MTKKTARKWRRLYIHKIASLFPSLVSLIRPESYITISQPLTSRRCLFLHQIGTLEDNDDGLIFMLSVDGTHCKIQEPRPFSTEHSSHKFGGKPGVNYELGILLHKPQLAWCYGPTRPGLMNDLTVFQQALGPALLAMGRRAIGDGIYSPDTEVITSKNDFDPAEVAIFKNRALARHEKYNGLLKNFNVLRHAFRHSNNNLEEAHRLHFHAVIVLVQAQLDNSSFTLFDSYSL